MEKEFQEAVKPILIPLLDGKSTFIRPYQQKLLAAWATMCVMTSEFYQPDQAAISFEDREYLRLYREPPKAWKIWIGRYLRGRWRGYWIHHSLPITENVLQSPDDSVPPPNTQTTTFIVGQLYIHAFSSSSIGLTDHWRLDAQFPQILAQLWPLKDDFIVWPTNDIRDIEADRIAGQIFWQLDRIARSS